MMYLQGIYKKAGIPAYAETRRFSNEKTSIKLIVLVKPTLPGGGKAYFRAEAIKES
jgi:hypothetical protein